MTIRSIPAWAGNPDTRMMGMDVCPVYPRVGGEPRQICGPAGISQGLSPRGRGTRGVHLRPLQKPGSIPAWAGNPPYAKRVASPHPVYPRVGGEPSGVPLKSQLGHGLSPRGRGTLLKGALASTVDRSIPAWAGNPVVNSHAAQCSGSIPAWAGNPSRLLPIMSLRTVYPRVGGEPLRAKDGLKVARGLSPRGRGTRLPGVFRSYYVRSIPAWAGNP